MDHLKFTKVELPANERRKKGGFGTKISKNYATQGNLYLPK